jgi:putative DNA primase/helicase
MPIHRRPTPPMNGHPTNASASSGWATLAPRLRWVLEHFPGAKPSGAGWMSRCPAHDDNTPSLSISQGTNGKVLVHCHARCSLEDVLERAGLRVAHLDPTVPAEVAAYDYRDEAGELLFQVVRMDPKAFRQRTPNGAGGWHSRLGDVRRVLYRLPELLAADPASPVFYPEGEKDADRLAAIGLVATTHSGGAGKWRPEYAAALRGRRVVVLPDNDAPGRAGARQVAAGLVGVAAWVKVLDLPGLPDKGDVSDWLAANGFEG